MHSIDQTIILRADMAALVQHAYDPTMYLRSCEPPCLEVVAMLWQQKILLDGVYLIKVTVMQPSMTRRSTSRRSGEPLPLLASSVKINWAQAKGS